MFFKRKTNHIREENTALYAGVDSLVAQRKYLPYLRRPHNNVTSYQAGDIRSAFKGRGMELEEVRSYGYGDDVRGIDWRVTARKGDTYTKIFSEEKDREVYVVLDLSTYMLFGTRHELKSVAAAKLMALLGWQSLANKDRFGVLLFNGNTSRMFKPQNNQKNLMAVFNAVAEMEQEQLLAAGNRSRKEYVTDLSVPLGYLQYSLKSRASVFIISSFNYISEQAKKTIAALTRRNRLYCINVYDRIEEVAPADGEYMAEYNGEKLVFNTSSKEFQETYSCYFAQKRQEMEDFCRKFGCQYVNIRTGQPLYKQLKLL